MTEQTWLAIPQDSQFSLANLPYGVVSYPDSAGPHVVVALGDHVVDLAAVAAFGLLDTTP